MRAAAQARGMGRLRARARGVARRDQSAEAVRVDREPRFGRARGRPGAREGDRGDGVDG